MYMVAVPSELVTTAWSSKTWARRASVPRLGAGLSAPVDPVRGPRGCQKCPPCRRECGAETASSEVVRSAAGRAPGGAQRRPTLTAAGMVGSGETKESCLQERKRSVER